MPCRAVLVRSVGLATLLSLGSVPGRAWSAEPPPAPTALATHPEVLGAERLFSAWLEAQVAYRGLPGVAVGVVSDQEVVWTHGFGFADVQARVPVSARTRFRVASNSKLFSAVAIMQLREEGKLRLDDPVVKYLPGFRPAPAGDDDGPITIEQLLSHSSGLPREAGDHWSTFRFPTSEELGRLYPERQAAYPPSVRWKYSNLAYAVAGAIIERVSGQRWADYVGQHIFGPLGMKDSSVDQDVPGLAVPYGRRLPDGTRQVLPFVDSRALAAAAGVTSTVEDLARFISAQFRRGPRGGPQIVSGGSWRELLRVRSVEETWTSGSGLGFDVKRVKDRTYIGHAGVYPGNTSQTLIQLDDRVGVIVLTNANDAAPGDIAQQLMATVGQAVVQARAPLKPPSPAWDRAWERYAGLYRGFVRDQHVVVLDRRLVLITPEAATLDDRVALEPLGGGRFRYVAPTGSGNVGEVVRFVEEGGKPTHLVEGDTWYERVAGH